MSKDVVGWSGRNPILFANVLPASNNNFAVWLTDDQSAARLAVYGKEHPLDVFIILARVADFPKLNLTPSQVSELANAAHRVSKDKPKMFVLLPIKLIKPCEVANACGHFLEVMVMEKIRYL